MRYVPLKEAEPGMVLIIPGIIYLKITERGDEN